MPLPSPAFVTGWRYRLRQWRSLAHVVRLAYRFYPDRREARAALRGLREVIRQSNSIRHITKGVQVDGRFYTLLSYPGRPSAAFDLFIKNELHRIRPIHGHQGLLLAIVAITKKCPLRCEHCFEWDALNGRETLTREDLAAIVGRLQRHGVAQIELSGGEPLNRFDDLLFLLRQSDHRSTDFWLLTSGHRLTAERAQALKAAGLTGVAVSVDHWEAAAHDRFRGLNGAFEGAMNAAREARAAGLVTAFSLVPVRGFCTAENLWRYAEMARDQGVHLLRILEPRASGRYAGQAVELSAVELQTIESFVCDLQRDRRYRHYPPVEYYGTYQRAVGCSGAGQRYLYVDTDGGLHACPFCQHTCGNMVQQSLEEGLVRLQEAGGCHAFHTV
jgi:MoaA/NifB/PqqE/SkfB family radical SAM enzyme